MPLFDWALRRDLPPFGHTEALFEFLHRISRSAAKRCRLAPVCAAWGMAELQRRVLASVSYTHLTLPTICSV